MINETAVSELSSQDKDTWLRQIIQFFIKIIMRLMIVSIIVVLILRWIPAPTSGVIIQRSVESLLAEKNSIKRQSQWVNWQEISATVPLAAIAAEDQQFLNHSGFDFKQIDKALVAKLKGKRLRGASTITQQTAKNLFLWGDRSFIRKGLEAWFTVLIEFFWPKQRILEVYLNIVEFGSGIYGVEAASLNFFNKSAKNLNRHEAALLVAVLPNPHQMNVKQPSSYVLQRQKWIVKQMQQLGGVSLIKSI